MLLSPLLCTNIGELAFFPVPTGEQRKKLADVKVNPKIAASLGLKFAAPTPAVAAPASQPAAAPAAASNQVGQGKDLTESGLPAEQFLYSNAARKGLRLWDTAMGSDT